jgi:hypothetical protein
MADPIRSSGTPEAVAYVLMQDVMSAEGKTLHESEATEWSRVDRAYLLDLYTECLLAARAARSVDGVTRKLGSRTMG